MDGREAVVGFYHIYMLIYEITVENLRVFDWSADLAR